MGTIINKKIIEFGAKYGLNIVAQRKREGGKLTTITHYSISTDTGINLGRIHPACDYTTFLEIIVFRAIAEAERLSDLCTVQEEENAELCADFIALKEEATNDN